MFRSGQHFLINQSAIKKIAEALDMKKDDVVIEIGAGHGELTSELVNWLIDKNRKGRIILIEKDDALAEQLKEKYGEDKKVEIIHGDALKILPKLINQLTNQPINYKLAGNIPYYITGKLLRLISELEHKPSRCVFTVQKEVAERICAGMNPVRGRPANPVRNFVSNGAESAATTASGRSASNGMNRLAASVQFWAKSEIIEYVSRNDFKPAPEVDSAVVVLASRVRGQGSSNITPERYYRTVRILFQQPRKTILNNLAEGAPKTPKDLITKELQGIGVNPGDRPQNLSIGDITKIADILQ